MATKGKKISELSVADELQGNELIPFAKNGDNGATNAETIKEYCNDGMQGELQDSSDIKISNGQLLLAENIKQSISAKQDKLSDSADISVSAGEEGEVTLSLTERAKIQWLAERWNSICKIPQGNNSTWHTYGEYDEATGKFRHGRVYLTASQALRVVEMHHRIEYANSSGIFNSAWYLPVMPGIYTDRNYYFDMGIAFSYCRGLQSVSVGGYSGVLMLGACNMMFIGCTNLIEILGVIDMSSGSNCTDMFKNCPKLEEVNLKGLKTSISFSDSPLLMLQSVQYMVNNASLTTAITITVHPNVYAKITGDTSNEAYSSLSDEDKSAWTSILQTALNKNISFATI